MRIRSLIAAAAVFVPALASAQPAGPGLNVRVVRAGQPVANAVVCSGISVDLNQFAQGTTDAQGRVNLGTVPQQAFLVTASASGRGAQLSFPATASPSGLPFLSTEIVLPVAAGGPSCPSTPAGPQRGLLPPNFVVPTAVPLAWTPIQLNTRREFCFGALGAQCGEPQTGIPATALCANGGCFINGGSWSHDECCFRNPNGMACRRGPLDAVTGNDGNCVTSWNKAVRLSSRGIFWRRNVDFSRANSTGTVEFNLYCAPANTLLNPGDGNRCCSGQTRALNAAETVAAAAANETLVACR